MNGALPSYVPLSLEDANKIVFNPCSVIDLAFCLQDLRVDDHEWHGFLLESVAAHYELSHLPIVRDYSEEAFFLGKDFKTRCKFAVQLYHLRRSITDTISRWEYEEPQNKLLTIAQHEDRPDLESSAQELWPLLEAYSCHGAALLPAIDRMLLGVYGVDLSRAAVTLVELLGEEVARKMIFSLNS